MENMIRDNLESECPVQDIIQCLVRHYGLSYNDAAEMVDDVMNDL